MKLPVWLETTAIVLAGAVAAGAFLTDPGPVRLVIVAAFLLVAPGLAVTTLAGVRDGLVRLVLIVPVSLAISALVATAVIYLGAWSTELIFFFVAAITVLAAAAAPYERVARGALVLMALLPGAVLIAAELSRGAAS